MAAIEVDSVYEGKITGITKFGAFVALPDGKSGLVHISEVANAYVNDIHDHLQLGQAVKVRVLSIAPDGKINLSIKRAVEQSPAPASSYRKPAPAPQPRPNTQKPQRVAADPPGNNQEFEDRLKKFMQEADSRIADNRIYSEHKQRSRRR